MILIIIAVIALQGYKKGEKITYKGNIGENAITFEESIITASQKQFEGKSEMFYFIKFKVSGGRNLYGSYLVSQSGFLEKFSISDSERKLIYKLESKAELLMKVNEFTGMLLKEIPQKGGSNEGVFLPFYPACWHYLMKSQNLISKEKIKVKVAVPLFDRESNAGHPVNMKFAENSDFSTVSIRLKLVKEGTVYKVKASPFNAEMVIDENYNILSFEWQGYDLKKE